MGVFRFTKWFIEKLFTGEVELLRCVPRRYFEGNIKMKRKGDEFTISITDLNCDNTIAEFSNVVPDGGELYLTGFRILSEITLEQS